MKVLFLLLGTSAVASSRVRGFWLIEELEAQGIHCRIITKSDLPSLIKSIFLIPFYNCLVLQKRYGRWDALLLKFAVLLGKKAVFDLDDKYSVTDNETTLNNLAKIMRSASAVTVGSRALLEFAAPYQSESYLLPTSVKLENYKQIDKTNRNVIVLGWIGNGRTYHTDLINLLKGPLTHLAREYAITLKLIGTCGQQDLYEVFGAIKGLNTQFIDALDWADQDEILLAMSDFDIGLYPLEDNDFNRFKCGFKALEYMAMGIPVVSSSVGANADIITHGVEGFLVDGDESWEKALKVLISDTQLRLSMGTAGRRKVERDFDVKNRAFELANILGAKV